MVLLLHTIYCIFQVLSFAFNFKKDIDMLPRFNFFPHKHVT